MSRVKNKVNCVDAGQIRWFGFNMDGSGVIETFILLVCDRQVPVAGPSMSKFRGPGHEVGS